MDGLIRNKEGWYAIEGADESISVDQLPDHVAGYLREKTDCLDWVHGDYDFGTQPTREQLFKLLVDVDAALSTISVFLYEEGGAFPDSADENDLTAYFENLNDMLVYCGIREIRAACKPTLGGGSGFERKVLPIRGKDNGDLKN